MIEVHNVEDMPYYTVRAETDAGAIYTFGLRAENYDQARLTAMDRLPQHGAWTMDINEVIRPEREDGQA